MFKWHRIGFVLSSLFLFTNCSHYGPVSIGQGEPSNFQVESCTDFIFGFPIFAERKRIDTVLRENNLVPADVATVESKSWFYLFPLYGNSCTIVSLNKEGAHKKIANAKEIESSNEPLKANSWDPSKNCKEKTGDLFFRNLKIQCLEDCQRVHPLNQKKCREAYKKKFNIK